MQFKIAGSNVSFEVSNLKHVVINDAELITEHKTKEHPARIVETRRCVVPTRIWSRTATAKGDRWLKYRYLGLLPEPNGLGYRTHTAKPEGGASGTEVRKFIQDAMARKGINVWFSGDTCNIVRLINYRDAMQVLKENEIAKPRLKNLYPQNPRQCSTGLNDAIREIVEHAAQQAGARVVGPVMVVQGRGNRTRRSNEQHQ